MLLMPSLSFRAGTPPATRSHLPTGAGGLLAADGDSHAGSHIDGQCRESEVRLVVLVEQVLNRREPLDPGMHPIGAAEIDLLVPEVEILIRQEQAVAEVDVGADKKRAVVGLAREI